MNVYRRLILLAAVCLMLAPAFGQDTTRAVLPAVWSLDECLAYARANNIQLSGLRLTREISEQELSLSRASVLPDLYGSASQNFDHSGRPGNGTAFGVSGSYGVSSSLTLYRGGYLHTDIRQKGLQVQASEYDVKAGENDIILQIVQAYLNILLDKEQVIYNTDLVVTSQAQLTQARQRFQVGSIARKDVAQFEAQLANDQYSLTSTRNAERQDKLLLKQILQLPTDQPFEVVKPDTIVQSQAVAPLRQVQETALANRPEVKSSELGIEISKLDVDKARTGYLPSISVGAGLSSGYANGNGYGLFNQFGNNFAQSIGVTLSVPLFTKRLNRTNVAEAQIGVRQAELDLRATRTNLSQEVEQSYISLLNANDQLNAATEQLRYTQEVYRIATQELKIGAANIVDFYQQRNLYVQALQTYIRAKYTAALAQKIYEFYLGTPVKL